MISAQNQAAFDDYVGPGYRLTLVNSYTVNGEDMYVDIWENSFSLQWFARHGMSSTDYSKRFR